MSLPADYAARGAPSGSPRALALLFAPPARRAALEALFALDGELSVIADGREHAVAHLKLDWWADELARLANGTPRHPITRALAAAAPRAPAFDEALQRRLVAARESLAQLPPADDAELRARLERSHGSIAALAALLLDAPECTAAAVALGVGLGHLEVARDVALDARRGRLRLPLALLGDEAPTPEALAAEPPRAWVRKAQLTVAAGAAPSFQTASAGLEGQGTGAVRPLIVLLAIARAELKRWQRGRPPKLPPGRLAPLRALFLAWRAARRAPSGTGSG